MENNIIDNITVCCNYNDTITDSISIHFDFQFTQTNQSINCMSINSAVPFNLHIELKICIVFFPKEKKNQNHHHQEKKLPSK